MKRAVGFLLALTLILNISGACFAAGKVAIVTMSVSQNEEEFRSAEEMKAKYGDRIIHVTWPDNFMLVQELMINLVSKIAADPDVKALIINQAVPGTNAAVGKLLETRNDIFIIYCLSQENPLDSAKHANIVLAHNYNEIGNTIPIQAKALGAKTLVHYSFQRHMSVPLLAGRRDLMRQKCAEIGLKFVDAEAPDPMGAMGVVGSQQFILKDLPKMVEKYGADTAFFATNCAMQVPMIKAVIDTKAIYPQPCCPSPFHGFPVALGLESNEKKLERTAENLQFVIDQTRKILKEKGVQGRLSTWPVPITMMFTAGATKYAFKVIDGETSFDKLDKALLDKCLSDYAQTDIVTTPLVEAGQCYPNFLLTLIGFLTY